MKVSSPRRMTAAISSILMDGARISRTDLTRAASSSVIIPALSLGSLIPRTEAPTKKTLQPQSRSRFFRRRGISSPALGGGDSDGSIRPPSIEAYRG